MPKPPPRWGAVVGVVASSSLIRQAETEYNQYANQKGRGNEHGQESTGVKRQQHP